MATREEVQAFLEAAKERAATKVDSWIPEKVGDRLAGEVIEVGTITTRYGDYYTTILKVWGDYVENGETKDGDSKLIRAAWMGAVLKAQFLRTRPGPDDLVAFHFQETVTPQSGMNDYDLIVAAVMDPETGKAKIPVDLSIAEVTHEQVINADPKSGEVAPTSEPVREGPRPGEEDF